MSRQVIRIGTRASRLATAQSGMMQQRVARALGGPPDEVAPLVLCTTTGDRIQDRRLLEAGGKALFTKELEEALIEGRIDCAVHSMKDVPAELPMGLVIAAIPEREDVRDAFLSRRYARFDDLPQGARLGTASLRRQAQALARRPDLEIVMLRGNVDTRIRKLDAGEFDAILLAAAGLNRLGLSGEARELLDPVAAPPAPGQGALAIEVRAEDAGAGWLKALHDPLTEIAVAAERGAMLALEGSCRTAIGAYGRIEGDELLLSVEALTPDGARRFRREGRTETRIEAAKGLGVKLGIQIQEEGGDALVWDG